MRSGVAGLTQQVQAVDRDLPELKAELWLDASPVRLESAVSAFMLDVFSKKAGYRVAISQAKPVASTGSTSAVEISRFAQGVRGTDLLGVEIGVTGSYQDYQGLVDYLHLLNTKHPAALTRLSVQDSTFEVTARVYGLK